MMFEILVINPGSTSTKTAVFHDADVLVSRTFNHDTEELSGFQTILDQRRFRTRLVLNWLEEQSIALADIDAVVGRGGLLKPIEGGCYAVNPAMMDDLEQGLQGQHASNLGGLIAVDIARLIDVKAYIADPVVVDELDEIARFSGHPAFERKSIFHALNQKAVAREAARILGKTYQNCRLIVAHLGGGISIGAHVDGKVIDVNNALNGEGPFSPERSGSLPAGQLVHYCFNSGKDEKTILSMLTGNGGLAAYLNSNDTREIENQIQQGNRRSAEVMDAMAYQIAKSIGALSVVLAGRIDAIVLTGGLAKDNRLIETVRGRVEWIAECVVIPGEREMQALALSVLRVLNGQEKTKQYS